MKAALWAVLSAALVLSAPAARADWKKDANKTTDKVESSVKSGAHKTKVKTDSAAHKAGKKTHKAEDKAGKSLKRTGSKMEETHPSPSPTTGEKSK